MVVVIELEAPTLFGRPAIVSMPTPIGHALGGIAAGVVIVGVSKDSGIRLGGRRLPVFPLFALLGVLADVDFLIFTPHRYVTHSLGAGFVVGLLAMLSCPRQPVIWAASTGAYLSHVLLDWLGNDTVKPLGVMALWPFDAAHYQAPFLLFRPVCRQYWLLDCWVSLAVSVGYELLVLGTVALAAVALNRRRVW